MKMNNSFDFQNAYQVLGNGNHKNMANLQNGV
jgi:hypothetical protein